MKTVDEIYGEMTAAFARETGMEPDGTGELAVRMYALATQVYGLYVENEWTRRQCFPQTATGEELDKHAFLRGLTRLPASRAEGTLRFSVRTAVERDLSIPKGTVCRNPGLVAFATTEEGWLPAGSLFVDVPAQAVEAGTGGNTPAGTVRAMTVAPTGIAACTNATAFSGGRAAEEDEALRTRVLDTYRTMPNGTNVAYYEKEAMEVEGVAAVQVIAKNRGLGTVDVVIAGVNGLPGAELVSRVQAVLAKKREITVDLQVLAPVAVPVNVVVSVKPAKGRLPQPVQDAVEGAITAWFHGQLLGKPVLVAQLSQVIYQVDGVENYQILTPTGDVAAAQGKLPVLGTLLVEELL